MAARVIRGDAIVPKRCNRKLPVIWMEEEEPRKCQACCCLNSGGRSRKVKKVVQQQINLVGKRRVAYTAAEQTNRGKKLNFLLCSGK